ncbi:MAG: FliM/FliN family flagellar motor switch protein [Hyphomicrobiales bacterium]
MNSLNDVEIELVVVLGRADMPIHQLLRMGRGAVIELGTDEDDEVQILANNMPIAKGQVMLSGEKIAVEVSKKLSQAEVLADGNTGTG